MIEFFPFADDPADFAQSQLLRAAWLTPVERARGQARAQRLQNAALAQCTDTGRRRHAGAGAASISQP
jgi:hypothetical protein